MLKLNLFLEESFYLNLKSGFLKIITFYLFTMCMQVCVVGAGGQVSSLLLLCGSRGWDLALRPIGNCWYLLSYPDVSRVDILRGEICKYNNVIELLWILASGLVSVCISLLSAVVKKYPTKQFKEGLGLTANVGSRPPWQERYCGRNRRQLGRLCPQEVNECCCSAPFF